MSDAEQRRGMKPIVAIFLTVFIDLLGFGLFIPDLQLRGKELATQLVGSTADPGQIGLLTGISLAVFSLAQLLTAPFLGRLSDRVGRRSILLITCLLSVCSYVVYAHATEYWIVLIARALSGIAAANLGVAFAFVADVTTPENRAKGMGMIGAAFGLGFVLGPAMGAYLLWVSHNDPLWIGYVGATLSFINFLFVLYFVPRMKPSEQEKTHLLQDIKVAFSSPGLPLLLAMFFALNLGFTNLESTFFQLLADPNWIHKLGPDARQTGGILMFIVGVVMVIMQGGVVRAVTPKYGEVRILRIAYLGLVPSLALAPFLPLWIPMILGIIFLGASSGLAQPSLSSLISRMSPQQLQGGVFGVTQSLGACARFLGPLISNSLFAYKPYAPYLFGAFLILFPAMAAWKLKQPK